MKKIIFLLILTLGALSSSAAIVNPVKWSVEVKTQDSTNEGLIIITANIQDGYHIYGFKNVKDGPVATSITFEDNPAISLSGSPQPSEAPHSLLDKAFDLQLEEWSGQVSFTQKFNINNPNADLTLKGSVRYMACLEQQCTPPDSFNFTLNLGQGKTQVVETAEIVDRNSENSLTDTAKPLDNEQIDWWAPVNDANISDSNLLTGDTSWWNLLIMGFLGGLLALLTPCVWPMIPMTVSFFLKKSGNRRKSIMGAMTYGLSIIIIYLILGIAITLMFGAGALNALATSAVFNIIFFALLVLFAISFFGAFDIKLPSRWTNAIDDKAATTTGLLSIFFMAFTLVLVSFSCTGPIIGTLLVQAASDDSILGPALGMGGFALGLAIPFALFALFPSLLKEMPRSGGWMNSVKVVLGFIELILSLKFLSVADLAYGWHILDREVFLAIWIVLFILLGMYLLGKLRFGHDAPSDHTSVGGFFLAVCSFSFAVYLIPGLWGAPLKSISAFAPPLKTQDFNLYGGEFKEFDDYDKGMTYAAKHGKPVLLDFSGHACVNCRKMEGAVFDNKQVRTIINDDYVLIKLMVDEKADLPSPLTVTENGKQITLSTVGDKWSYLQRYKFSTNTQPYYVILDNQGQMLNSPRSYDEDVDIFVKWLKQGLENYNKIEK
ncbi:MAG: thioredoxin family protein [Muribaculaceae bacterium]|nr:thioredoxin family protein [Muribaculaceae bacterium]